MEPIRCLLHSSSINGKTVREYSLKTGKHITEIITDSGNNEKRVREIYKDILGYPEKVIDTAFGCTKTYYPAKNGVIMESAGEKHNMSALKIEHLTRIV